MESNQVIEQTKSKLSAAFAHLQDELVKLRTGRANPTILDKLMVKAYGVEMPLNQLANVTAPEVQLIQITPYDVGNIQSIAQAVREDQNLGLNPVDDGVVIRLSIPPLTTERRQLIAKQLSDISEKCMIAMRNGRHEGLRDLEIEKKSKNITEDDFSSISKQIDSFMGEYKVKIEQLISEKQKEVMTV
ncbi:MAG TPA: ribosome recycling factor [Candidatus Saccharimonadia bacterium]|nr:ribosome recycling factor [Candidatus Saccharimonadia bacterium]